MKYDPGLSPQLQPYVYHRDAYEVECCGRVPEISFIDSEKLYPTRPEDEADDAKGYQGVNGQEQLLLPEKAPCLGDCAELDWRLATCNIEGYSDQVHYQIHRGPEDDQPTENDQMILLIRAGPDAQNSKKELEDAKRDTNGQCLECRCLKKTRFDLL